MEEHRAAHRTAGDSDAARSTDPQHGLAVELQTSSETPLSFEPLINSKGMIPLPGKAAVRVK